MSERQYIYKGNKYGSLTDISDKDFAFFNTRRIRNAVHLGAPISTSIIARKMEGLTYLAWSGATLMPAKKTFDLAVAVACMIDSQGRSAVVGDIGTGSGVFPITIASLLNDNSSFFATDISGHALHAASLNAQINGLPIDRIRWKKTNGLGNLNSEVSGFDVIFSNPPFKSTSDAIHTNKSGFHPTLALDGGNDGMHYYRQFTKEAVPMLHTGGALIFQLPPEEEGIARVVRSVYPIYHLPIHLLADNRKEHTQHHPLFMTIGGTDSMIQSFEKHQYRTERI